MIMHSRLRANDHPLPIRPVPKVSERLDVLTNKLRELETALDLTAESSCNKRVWPMIELCRDLAGSIRTELNEEARLAMVAEQ
jgi:hypothetical protein